jgi:hypothetical protein
VREIGRRAVGRKTQDPPGQLALGERRARKDAHRPRPALGLRRLAHRLRAHGEHPGHGGREALRGLAVLGVGRALLGELLLNGPRSCLAPDAQRLRLLGAARLRAGLAGAPPPRVELRAGRGLDPPRPVGGDPRLHEAPRPLGRRRRAGGAVPSALAFTQRKHVTNFSVAVFQ